MKTHMTTTRRITTIIVFSGAVIGILLWHNTVLTYDGPPKSPVHQFAHKQIGVPVRITIPSIAVDAAIEKVALAKDGSMDVPQKPLDTAWYEPGPRPGENGSATIAGHVDWYNGAQAVFAALHKIQPGDVIRVQDDAGTIVSFVVRESKNYNATANAVDVFRSNDGKAHLNLITCAGVWDVHTQQYTKRLVVFADRTVE